jgi:hypothetical protein
MDNNIFTCRIGNDIKGTSGDVRLWLVVSVLLLAISFLAFISVFFFVFLLCDGWNYL